MQDEVGTRRKCSLNVENIGTSPNHVIDEFEVYRSRAYSFAGGCLLDVKHTSLGGVSVSQQSAKSLPVTPRLMPITDTTSACTSDDSGVSDVTCSPSPKNSGMVSRQERRSTMPSPLRKSKRKRYARKASCPEAQTKVEKPKFFLFGNDVGTPCGMATRVEACGKTTAGQKHRVRLVSEDSIENTDTQQFKTVNFVVKEGTTDQPIQERRKPPRVSRQTRMSLPTNLLHMGHQSKRSRTPSPSHSKGRSSSSQGKARRPSELPMDNHSSGFRPRTRSMPSRSKATKLQQHRSFTVTEGYPYPAGMSDCRHHSIMSTGDDLETEAIYRVRSFSTSGKTVVNRGDSFKSCTTSSGHASLRGSISSTPGEESFYTQSRTSSLSSQGEHSDCSSCGMPPPMYKVLMLGMNGVGKSSLSQQFTTSEYMGHVDTLPDEDNETIVSVMLDEEESMLYFVDVDPAQEPPIDDDVDAFVVVYSVTDTRSFRHACNVLEGIKKSLTLPVALIMVANKADIVRNRVVSEREGREAAWSLGCKYIEVSAVLNHKVDELLVGVLSQIKLNCERPLHNPWPLRNTCLPHQQGCMQRVARGLFSLLLRKNAWALSSCDNLLEL